MSECTFCAISEERAPAHVVYEDARVIGFLDINPIAPGHTLVVPRVHASGLLDAGEDDLRQVMSAAQVVARRLTAALGADGVNILHSTGASAGQEVGHLHIHVVPRSSGDGADLMGGGVAADRGELERLAGLIRAEGDAEPIEVHQPVPDQRKRAIAVIEDYLAERGEVIEWEHVEEGFYFLRIPGTARRWIPIEISVQQRTVWGLSYYVVEPEENQEAAYLYLLQKNFTARSVAFASNHERTLCLTGRVPLEQFSPAALDELIGKIVDTTETTFQKFLRIGFESRFAEPSS